MAAGDRVELSAARIGMQYVAPGALRSLVVRPGTDAEPGCRGAEGSARHDARWPDPRRRGRRHVRRGRRCAGRRRPGRRSRSRARVERTRVKRRRTRIDDIRSARGCRRVPGRRLARPDRPKARERQARHNRRARRPQAPRSKLPRPEGPRLRQARRDRRVAVDQRRIGLIFALFFGLLVLAAGRSLYLGVVRGASLRRAAQSQQLTYEPVPAQRGAITDRNGVDLAVSEPARDISADPYLIRDPLGDARRLAPLLGQTQRELLSKLTQHSRLCLPGPGGAGRSRARDPGARNPRGDRNAGDAPRLSSRNARGTGARVVGTEGGGLAGLEYSRNAVLAGRAGQRRVVSDALGQPVSIAEVRHEVARRIAVADARRQHPAARRRRARRRGAGVQPQRRHRDRDGPAQRSDPRDGQLAAGQRQRTRGGASGARWRTARSASTTNRARRSRR